MKFNEKLVELRKRQGLSQEQLGMELQVSRQTVSKWESCQSYPDFQRLVLLSDYFGLTLDELVKDIDVQEVRDKNISSEKINSIYNDVNTAKSFIKWEKRLRRFRASNVWKSIRSTKWANINGKRSTALTH